MCVYIKYTKHSTTPNVHQRYFSMALWEATHNSIVIPVVAFWVGLAENQMFEGGHTAKRFCRNKPNGILSVKLMQTVQHVLKRSLLISKRVADCVPCGISYRYFFVFDMSVERIEQLYIKVNTFISDTDVLRTWYYFQPTRTSPNEPSNGGIIAKCVKRQYLVLSQKSLPVWFGNIMGRRLALGDVKNLVVQPSSKCSLHSRFPGGKVHAGYPLPAPFREGGWGKSEHPLT